MVEWLQKVISLDGQPKMAIVEKGEKLKDFVQGKKEYYESIGIKCDWYYFPEDISNIELFKEVKDLVDFYDGIWLTDDTPWVSQWDLRRQVPKMIIDIWEEQYFSLEDKNVLVIGSGQTTDIFMRVLWGRVKGLMWCDGDPWRFIGLADLIICDGFKLNCYAVHKPVIEMGIGDCYNIEGRKIYRKIDNGLLFDEALIKSLV